MGVGLGASFTLASIATETLSFRLTLRGDPIMNQRRLFGLSLVTGLIWGSLLLLGASIDRAFGVSVFRAFSLYGLSLAGGLRSIVIGSLSARRRLRVHSSVVLQPIMFVVLSWPLLRYEIAEIISFVSGLIIVSAAASLLIVIVDKKILARTGKIGLGLFRAFVLNWVEGAYEPLESILDDLGCKADVSISALRFTSSSQESLVVVPTIHPGPLKNVGSSELPQRISSVLPLKTNTTIHVPHGPSGHELDLTSHKEMEKVLKVFRELLDARSAESELVTKFTRVQKGAAKASCQIFGRTALITLTASPLGIEDIPRRVGEEIESIAKELGLSAIVVDAHNSYEDNAPIPDEGTLSDLIEAAHTSMHLADSSETSTFEVGSARTTVQGYGVYEGIGPDGVGVLIIRTAGQTTSYIIIDGNNMVKGLREEILTFTKDLGIDEGEVMTTDTHVVNALSPGGRGYHPVGEAVNRSVIRCTVCEVVGRALARMELGRVSFGEAKIENVRVLGTDFVSTIGLLVDESVRRAKYLAVMILLPSCVLSALVFILLLTQFL
jgi:putative membrane protein